MLTGYGAAAETKIWAVLPGDNGRRIPGAQVPKTTRPSPGPASSGDIRGRKGGEKRNTQKGISKKRDRIIKQV